MLLQNDLFADSSKAAASIFPNRGRCRYNDVQVLLLRWEHDEMGVEYELDDLAVTFKNAYGFNTETWLIPTTQPHLALMGKAFKMVQDFGQKDNLLIVYYAGHGGMNSSRQPLWTWSAISLICIQIKLMSYFTSTSHPNSPSLQWFAVQTIFEQAESDTLLLLDCCAAASSAPADGHCFSVTETIAACGFETWAPQPGRHSFTNTIIAVLDEWCGHPGLTAAMLHCEVLNRLRHEKPERKGKMKKFECRRTPVHILSTADARAGSVELCRRRSDHNTPGNAKSESPEDKTSVTEDENDIEATQNSDEHSQSANSSTKNQNLYDAGSLTKVLINGCTALPQVLISVALEEEQLLDFDQCRRWLQQFPALAKYAKVQGVYRSNSTLLILSLPVLIWDWIPDDNAYSFIGYIHSSNLDLEDKKAGDIGQSHIKQEEQTRQCWDTQNKRTTQETPSQSFDHGFRAMPVKGCRLFERKPMPGKTKEATASPGAGSHAWTVHVSLLPRKSQPFPFEKDTAAYKRCLSRGLHQMLVVPDSDASSFQATVNKEFFEVLRGRPWEPLAAKLCDAEGLRGLPMLRPLPEHLVGGGYSAEFLQQNCAVVDKNGKILDLYIAMSEDTISWSELKEATPFTPGLEASWTYDPYLDGLCDTDGSNTQLPRRYESSESNQSVSTVSTNVQHLQSRINLANTRPLRPKSGHSVGYEHMYRDHLEGSRIDDPAGNETSDPTTATDKVIISSKPIYTRLKHDRVFCKQCASHPDGFRGEHELRRHQDREHSRTIKKWICIEPTDPGHPTPVLPLSNCKACKKQRQFSAYYNAAAHLRRAHFRPKRKDRSKSGSGDDKRGGKGGGDWPTMTELKFWMKEIEVPVDYSVPPSLWDFAGTDDEVEDEMFQTHMGTSHLSPLSFTAVADSFSNGCLSSQSANPQLWDIEEPDLLMLDDNGGVSTIEANNLEQAQFVDQYG
jgi:hypothetical protein